MTPTDAPVIRMSVVHDASGVEFARRRVWPDAMHQRLECLEVERQLSHVSIVKPRRDLLAEPFETNVLAQPVSTRACDTPSTTAGGGEHEDYLRIVLFIVGAVFAANVLGSLSGRYGPAGAVRNVARVLDRVRSTETIRKDRERSLRRMLFAKIREPRRLQSWTSAGGRSPERTAPTITPRPSSRRSRFLRSRPAR